MFVSIRLITEVAGVRHYYYHNYCCVLICAGAEIRKVKSSASGAARLQRPLTFGVQEHDGVAQICSGGFMGDGAYHHFMQAALDVDEWRLQTIDPQGPVKQQYACPSRT